MIDSNFKHSFKKFVDNLTFDELDALKFQLSLRAVNLLNNFTLPIDEKQYEIFNSTIWQIANIQPYSDRLKTYGLAYIGRPAFITDDVLKKLENEAIEFRCKAKPNYGQWISPIESEDSSTFAEELESSPELLKLICEVAGDCLPSYVSNYIYYDVEGQNSSPHVDNSFTAVTVMIGIKHCGKDKQSSSVIYWPYVEPFMYRLRAGEIAIFFGTTMIHGRTPVSSGEEIHSLLLSYRPKVELSG